MTPHRRNLLRSVSVGVMAALALVGCSPSPTTDFAKKFADIITKVQNGVKNLCASKGYLVPTADTVIAVLIGILGSSDPELAAATSAVIQEAITLIAAACPAAPPAVSVGPISADVHGKTVPIEFY